MSVPSCRRSSWSAPPSRRASSGLSAGASRQRAGPAGRSGGSRASGDTTALRALSWRSRPGLTVRRRFGRELETMRKDKGRAALVLDELSRYRDSRLRAWVAGAAADVLGDRATRLILSLARGRNAEVPDAAVSALLGLGATATQPVLPDLRRRLHSKEAAERIAAMQKLAAAGDESVLPLLEELAATAPLPEERDAARAATIALRAGGARSDDIP